MPSRKFMTRREFLITTLGAGTAFIAACSSTTPPSTPTPASKATEAPKPAATSAPAPAATTAPAPAATAAPAATVAASGPKNVARNRTLNLMWLGVEGKYQDHELWSQYALGSNDQNGLQLFHEPLYYYSAFANKMIPWLAVSHEYSKDYKSVTIKTRPGIKWSDGTPFTAEDVAFTLTRMVEQAPKIKYSSEVAMAVASAKATDDTTVKIDFKIPSPRFVFSMLSYKYDIGLAIVPKHVFKDQSDWTKFTYFDMAKGWPLTTGPWQLAYTSPTQKLIDRRDSWWAVQAGLVPAMPKVERIVYLPFPGETQCAQALISNQVDYTQDLRAVTIKQVVQQNQKITTHSLREPPYGYVDWWPSSLYVNTTKAPYDNADIRWAISYFLDRKQMIDVAYQGGGTMSKLPFPGAPPYMGLKPYFDGLQDLLAKYDTNEFNPAKGNALMEKNGWKKGADGYWAKDGQRFKLPIDSFFVFADVGPIIAEQLKKQGIDSAYAQPPDWEGWGSWPSDRLNGFLYGHGGSVADPWDTMVLYQSASGAVPGLHMVNFSRWTNKKYDDLVDKVYMTPMEDTKTLVDLVHQAFEIWLPELPDIQTLEWYHRIPMNTQYWTGWPTKEDPYVNGAFWHLTFQMVLNKLQPTG